VVRKMTRNRRATPAAMIGRSGIPKIVVVAIST
jgi:hypothetical protein